MTVNVNSLGIREEAAAAYLSTLKTMSTMGT
jgi:hypothetical protein